MARWLEHMTSKRMALGLAGLAVGGLMAGLFGLAWQVDSPAAARAATSASMVTVRAAPPSHAAPPSSARAARFLSVLAQPQATRGASSLPPPSWSAPLPAFSAAENARWDEKEGFGGMWDVVNATPAERDLAREVTRRNARALDELSTQDQAGLLSDDEWMERLKSIAELRYRQEVEIFGEERHLKLRAEGQARLGKFFERKFGYDMNDPPEN